MSHKPFDKLPHCHRCRKDMSWTTNVTTIYLFSGRVHGFIPALLCNDCSHELFHWLGEKGAVYAGPDPFPPLCIEGVAP